MSKPTACARWAVVWLIAGWSLALAAEPQKQKRLPFAPTHWTPSSLSSDLYESSPTFSPDLREMWFMRADRGFGKYRLMHSQCVDGRWSPPRAPAFAAPVPALEGDPSLTPEGKRLYYISSRLRGGADDDLDIWFIERDTRNVWGEPRRMPEPVNSRSAELFPRAMSEGRLLFGSSRAGGHGQGDLYIATPQADGAWKVENAGPPLSTAANEYEADVSRDGQVMAVVADRGDRSHLYIYDRRGDSWHERGRVAARNDAFQVGPLLSANGDRLLFAQEDGRRSGELFVVDLRAGADKRWPPRCE
jgi:Tol biopolymer transport system component